VTVLDTLLRRAREDLQVSVWLVLITATVGTAVLGLEQAAGGATAVGVLLLGIAFVKMRLVGIHFMELGNAPRPLRLMFEGYVLVTFTALTVLFLVM
jgi:caa(3)-type oxidase subunit IV